MITGGSKERSRKLRKVSKAIVLGLNNGRSAYSIHQKLIKLSSVANARTNKQVRTRIGRKIHIPDNATYIIYSVCRSEQNVTDPFKLALRLISRGLEGVDARIVNTFHDEIMVEARDGIEDQVEATVKESM